MKQLKKPCANCGRPVKSSWTVCPYCKSRQVPAERVADGSEGTAEDAGAAAGFASEQKPAPATKKKKPAPAGSEA
jgi:DNA-directed RNA polymerase subunit RPC12/RpoP